MSNDALDGLIIDNFAGGGGASTGIELALGRFVDYAINHDPDSIAMHKANHPNTIHLCEDVFAVNPVKLCAGRPVLLAWFSPDCKHFSKAKGGKPRDKHIRGLAWVAVKWAKTVKPRIIMLENVEEFQTWGPLDENGNPVKEKVGTTFRKFVKEFENLGYAVEFRELIAADYGAPTKRKRFFMVARCDGQPIAWPEKTFAERGKERPGQKTWRSAASIIDFSIPTKSIFGRERDLAEPTKRRIGRGLEKFVLKSADPFIIPVGYGENKGQKPRVNDIGDPLSTVVSSTKQNVVVPYLQDAKYARDPKRRLLDIRDPNQTIAAGGNHTELIGAKLTPYLALIGEGGFQKYRDSSVEDPIKTIVSKNEHLVCAPLLAPYMGVSNFEDPGRDCRSPLATITSFNKELSLEAELAPFISQNFGGSYDGAGSHLGKPCPTVTADDHNRLVSPVLCPFIGINNFANRGADSKDPLPTVTTAPAKNVLIAPVITDYKFSNDGSRADAPLPTETAVRSHYLTTPYLAEYYGASSAAKADDPLPTVTSKDRHGLVSGFIQEYYGGSYEGNGTELRNPVPTATVQPRFALVTIQAQAALSLELGKWAQVRDFINAYTTVKVAEDQMLLIRMGGKEYFISDIGMRMLTPRELYDAQGFPHDYIIDRDYAGKSYPANKQVARCGNAVPPPFAEALVRANLGDLCPKKRIPTMKALSFLQSRFLANRTPFNGVQPNGQTSLYSDFELLTKQVAEERKGASDA